MNKLIALMVSVVMAGTAFSEATIHLALDCREGVREISAGGEELRYDAGWYADADQIRIMDDGAVVETGTDGSALWYPESDKSAPHVLVLEALRNGQVVATETAEFALGYIRNVTARQLWPHKKVEICYEVAEDIGEVADENATLVLTCGNNTAKTVIGDTRCVPGLHRVVWDMETDGVSVNQSDAKFVVGYGEEMQTVVAPVVKNGTWSSKVATPSSWIASANNALRGVTPTFSGSRYNESGRVSSSDPLSRLSDGVINAKGTSYGNTVGIVSGTLTWTLSKPIDLKKLRINTHWGDGGRDGIKLNSIQIQKSGSSAWETLANSSLSYGLDNDNSGSDLECVFACSEDAFIADNVIAVRFDLGTQDNGGSGFTEFEAVGLPTTGSGVETADGLVHRWSFNGDLIDSVGGQTATTVGSVTSTENQYELAGGSNGSSYISLGSNVLPVDTGAVTIEIWATRNAVKRWARVIDIGSSTENYMIWAWNNSTYSYDTVDYNNKVNIKTGGEMSNGTEYLFVIRIEDQSNGSCLVTCSKYNTANGGLLGDVTSYTMESRQLVDIGQTSSYLGHSRWSSDFDAAASYNEMRVWNRILSDDELFEHIVSGPDATLASHPLVIDEAKGVSAPTAINTSSSVKDGMEVAGKMTLVYSPIDAERVTLEINGREVLSATEAGAFEWTPDKPGTYVLTHRAGKTAFVRRVIVPAPDDAKELEIGWLDEPLSNVFPNVYASVTSVTLAPVLRDLPKDAFVGCEELSVSQHGGLVIYNDWVLGYIGEAHAEVVVPEGVKGIASFAFAGQARLERVTLPSTLRHIGANAFEQCTGLECVELPEGLVSVGDSAFCDCTWVQDVVFPESLADIGNRAFFGCGRISALTLPPNLQTIGDDAFNGLRQVSGLRCPATVRTIGARAFKGVWDDEEVRLPEGLEALGADAFADCASIRRIALPAVATPVKSAFPAAYAQIESVTILGAPEVIAPDFCRDVVQLVGVQIPSSVTNIGSSAFAGLPNLAEITLPPNLRTIGEQAFRGDVRLTAVDLPQSLDAVGAGAFEACSNVRAVSCPGELGTLAALFPSAYGQITAASVNKGTTRLMDDLFAGCAKLANVDLPGGVAVLGARAFKDCAALTAFGVPNGVVALGEDAFSGCTGLTSLSLPEGLETISAGAFRNCRGISSLVIPSTVTFVGANAFNGCTALKSISYLGSCPAFDADCYSGTPSELVSYVIDGSRGWDGVPASRALPQSWPTANGRTITYWEPNTFEVTFDGNGGTPSSSVVVQTTGMTYVLPKDDPVMAYASFMGWWTQPVNGGEIKPTTKVEVTRAQKFYAHWKYHDYAVRFDANGGEGEMANQGFTVNTPAELSANRFVRRDCQFAGWALSPEGEVAFADGAEVENLSLEQDAVIVLYAVWEDQPWGVADYLNAAGQTFVCAGDADWCGDAAVSHDGTGSARSGAIPAADEGRQTTSVLRTTVVGGGTGSFWWKVSCEPDDAGDYYDYCSFTVDGVEIAKIAGETEWAKVGYEVTGDGEHILAWTFARDDWDEDETSFDNAAWVDEFVWTPTPVTLSFDAGGAEGTVPSPITLTAGAEVALPTPALLKKTGMEFVGWSDGMRQFAAGEVYRFGAADAVLVAVWRVKVWTLEEAANLTRHVLTTGGDVNWTVDLATNYDGVAAIRSGTIGDSQETWVLMSVDGPGTVSFRVLVSGEYNRGKLCDYLTFEVDGTQKYASYDADWENVEIEVVGAGAHTLKWTYLKNASKSVGYDCAWLDEIEWVVAELPKPTVEGDEEATVTGDAETGFVIKPSEGKTAVEVSIPQGVDAARVTVEVSPRVATVKPNGATVKIVSGGVDITEFLNVPKADGNGVVDLTKAMVKEEIVKEALDVEKGAVIELFGGSQGTANPTITTAPTKVGLFYQFREGATLGGMKDGDCTIGDGQPWTPEIKVKGGKSAFYSIGVGKGE